MSYYDTMKATWVNPNIEYLFDQEIIEYDIRDAGFSLIKEYHLLPDSKIRELESLEKGIERHKAIGVLQKNSEFSKSLLNKFAEIRKIFISMNHLSDDQIISVKKDAIFTIGQCDILRFGNVTFVKKNVYSSYLRFRTINNLEIYYAEDQFDIKGMSDRAINTHRLYMIDFLKKLIPLIENQDLRSKRLMKIFIMEYKYSKLEPEYYIEFNNISKDFRPLFNYKNLLIPLIHIINREVQD